jgi:hypothetical protein
MIIILFEDKISFTVILKRKILKTAGAGLQVISRTGGQLAACRAFWKSVSAQTMQILSTYSAKILPYDFSLEPPHWAM